MGEVAYKLELPEGLSGVHYVFHISQLKKCHAEMADIPLRDTVPLEAIQLDSELLAAKLSSFARFSGATIPRMKPPGNEKKTYGKTTHTYFLANPNLLYVGHSCISYFICISFCDPRKF